MERKFLTYRFERMRDSALGTSPIASRSADQLPGVRRLWKDRDWDHRRSNRSDTPLCAHTLARGCIPAAGARPKRNETPNSTTERTFNRGNVSRYRCSFAPLSLFPSFILYPSPFTFAATPVSPRGVINFPRIIWARRSRES